MARAGLEAGASLLFLHFPGTRRIEEGVDGAGRGGAQRIIGPACSQSTRAAIQTLCAQQGWRIAIDLFAANCNKLANRFASWTDEPDSEGGRGRIHNQIMESVQMRMLMLSSGNGVRISPDRSGANNREASAFGWSQGCPYRSDSMQSGILDGAAESFGRYDGAE